MTRSLAMALLLMTGCVEASPTDDGRQTDSDTDELDDSDTAGPDTDDTDDTDDTGDTDDGGADTDRPDTDEPEEGWTSELLVPESDSWSEATVDLGDRSWRLLDFSFAGYRLGVEDLASGVPCEVFEVTGDGDITDELQGLVDAALEAGGGRVRIPAGEFTLHSSIAVPGSSVSIEGAGSARTTIRIPGSYTPEDTRYEGVFTLGKPLGGWTRAWFDRGDVLASVTSAVEEGDTTLSVSDARAIEPGDAVVVRQYFWPGLVEANAAGRWESYEGWPEPTTDARREYSFSYLRRVVAISDDTISLDAPIPWRLDPANNPVRIQSAVDSDCDPECEPDRIAFQQELGVSGLTLRFEDNHNDSSYSPARATGAAVYFEGVVDGWVHDVQVHDAPRHGIYLEASARITVQQSAVHRVQDDGGGGFGYGFHVGSSQNVLVQDSYAERTRHGYLSQRALTSMLVWRQNVSAQARLGDDTHHSFVHANLWDRHESRYGSGFRSDERGATSSGAYETLGSGVVWNALGDCGRGGYGGGMLHYNPSSDGWGIVVGGAGDMPVFDGPLADPDPIPARPGLQVGPVLESPGLGSKDQNVLYEGIGQDGLRPSSLYGAQLARRTDSPVQLETCGASPEAAPIQPSTPSGPGVLVYDGDHLGWSMLFGGGCPSFHGGTWSEGCLAFDPSENHTTGGSDSLRLRTSGRRGAILARLRGCTYERSTFERLELHVLPESADLEFTLGIHHAPYPESASAEGVARVTLSELTPGAWNTVEIEMDSLGTGPFNTVEFRSTDAEETSFFIDDVRLIEP